MSSGELKAAQLLWPSSIPGSPGDPNTLQALYWAAAVMIEKGEPIPEDLRQWVVGVLRGLSQDAGYCIGRDVDPEKIRARVFASTHFRRRVGRPSKEGLRAALSDAVWNARSEGRAATLETAFAVVAEEFNTSEASVSRAWSRSSNYYPPFDCMDGDDSPP